MISQETLFCIVKNLLEILFLGFKEIVIFFENIVNPTGNLIAIYGIIFTIIIGIIFYVYGKNGVERKVLQNKTGVNRIIEYTLWFFLISLFWITEYKEIFFVINSVLILYILYLCLKAFMFIGSFYKSVISDKEIINKYLEENIRKDISKYYNISTENKKLNDDLDKIGNISRFVSEDRYEEYVFVRAKKAGYIKGIELNIFKALKLEKPNNTLTEGQFIKDEKDFIYVPFNIAIGEKVSEGDILYGVKNSLKIIEGGVNIVDENFFPVQEYLDFILKEKFNKIFEYIKQENYRSVNEELNEASVYINFVFDEEKFDTNLIGQINNQFLLPLQEEAFKQEDIRVLREIVGFSLRYLYKSIEQKSKEKFELFLKNLIVSFWYSLSIKSDESKKVYQEIYSQWIYEVAEYSLKSKANKAEADIFYSDAVESVFVSINTMLKYSYDKSDIKSLDLVLYIADSIFKEEKYEYRKTKNTQDLIDKKEAIIFGFTSCIYRERRKGQELDIKILDRLLTKAPQKLNDLLRTASNALDYSHIGKLNWDNLSWSNSEGILGIRSGTITTDRDIVLLLIDRLFFGFKNNLYSSTDIDSDIKNELMAIDNQLADKSKDTIYSCSEMSEGEFLLLKEKVLAIFKQIKTNYENNNKEELIKQNINTEKVKEYATENKEGYIKNSLIRKISTIVKIKTGQARGYNTFFYKERFVDKTNLVLAGVDTFGEGLARSENNILLNEVNKLKKGKREIVNKSNIIKLLEEKSKNFKYAIIWTKEYIYLEHYSEKSSFKPRWAMEDKESYPAGFQGKIGDMEIYSVFPFNEDIEQVDSVFFLNDKVIELDEFNPEIESGVGVYETLFEDYSLYFSITNLCELDTEKLEKISKQSNISINDLKTKVILQLYRGSEFNKKTNIDLIEIVRVKK